MDDIAVDPALYGAFYGDATLPAPAYIPDTGTPSSQSDFNVSGSSDPTAVLGGIASAITNVGNAALTLQQIPNTLALNKAAADQAAGLARLQLATQAGIATLGAKTQLAQAQAAYNRAAGVIDSNGWILLLTVAGVAIAAFSLMKKA